MTVTDEGKVLSPPRCAVVHSWLTAELLAEAERQAAVRGMHVDAHCADVLIAGLLKNARVR